jgi:hypothetical protein
MTTFAWVAIAMLLLWGAGVLVPWFAWRVKSYRKD